VVVVAQLWVQALPVLGVAVLALLVLEVAVLAAVVHRVQVVLARVDPVLVLPVRALLLRVVAVLAVLVLELPELLALQGPLVPALPAPAFPRELVVEAWILKFATLWNAASAGSIPMPSTPIRPPILQRARARAGSFCR